MHSDFQGQPQAPARFKIYLETKYSRDPDERLQTAIAGLKSETFFSRSADELRERIFSSDGKTAWDAGRASWERAAASRDDQPAATLYGDERQERLNPNKSGGVQGRDAGPSPVRPRDEKPQSPQDRPGQGAGGDRPRDPEQLPKKASTVPAKGEPGHSAGQRAELPKDERLQSLGEASSDRQWAQVREAFGLDQSTIDKMRREAREVEAAAPKPVAPAEQPTDQERERRGDQLDVQSGQPRAEAKPVDEKQPDMPLVKPPVEHERGGERRAEQPEAQPSQRQVEPQRDQHKPDQSAEQPRAEPKPVDERQPDVPLVKPPAEYERGGEQRAEKPEAQPSQRQVEPQRDQPQPDQSAEQPRAEAKPVAEKQPDVPLMKPPAEHERGGEQRAGQPEAQPGQRQVEPQRDLAKPEQPRAEAKLGAEQQPDVPLVKPPAEHERGSEQRAGQPVDQPGKRQDEPLRDQPQPDQSAEQPRAEAKPVAEKQPDMPLVKPPAEHERGSEQRAGQPVDQPGQRQDEPQRDQAKPDQPGEQPRIEAKPAVEQPPSTLLVKQPAEHERGGEQRSGQPEAQPGQRRVDPQVDQVKPGKTAEKPRTESSPPIDAKAQRAQLFAAIAERASQIKQTVESRFGKPPSVSDAGKRVKAATRQMHKDAPPQQAKKAPPRDRGMDR